MERLGEFACQKYVGLKVSSFWDVFKFPQSNSSIWHTNLSTVLERISSLLFKVQCNSNTIPESGMKTQETRTLDRDKEKSNYLCYCFQLFSTPNYGWNWQNGKSSWGLHFSWIKFSQVFAQFLWQRSVWKTT